MYRLTCCSFRWHAYICMYSDCILIPRSSSTSSMSLSIFASRGQPSLYHVIAPMNLGPPLRFAARFLFLSGPPILQTRVVVKRSHSPSSSDLLLSTRSSMPQTSPLVNSPPSRDAEQCALPPQSVTICAKFATTNRTGRNEGTFFVPSVDFWMYTALTSL